jgi:ribosome-associated protein
MPNMVGDAGFGARDTVKGMVLATPVLSKSASSKPSRSKPSLAKTSASKSASSKAPKAARKPSAPAAVLKARPDADDTLKLILSRLDDMKAEETVTIDLRGKSAFSDYMIVTSGRANRHVGAIAENLAKGLKETGIKNLHVEGLPNCDWVLIDSGDVIVHVFRPEVREFYNLERLWTQGPTTAKAV